MTHKSVRSDLPAFAGYGVEIEYMIVDRDHLDIRPFADRLLAAGAGEPASEVVHGNMGWSNELAMHLIELKNLRPVAALEDLVDAFHAEVLAVNDLLAPFDACLMPGGVHPWMDPTTDTRLWTLDNAAIYACFDRIFDCRRHGWGNLQSIHLNLPYSGDEEFARLHAAIRLALPILPALAASSPWADKRPTGYMDYRLVAYRDHQKQVPSSMGSCIPDPSASPREYQTQVLAPMYREVAEYGAVPGQGDVNTLRHEWLNVRAAAPRFERSAIEIRILDTQECPFADLAVAAATAALVRHLYDGVCAEPEAAGLDTGRLVAVFERCIQDAERADIDDPEYLELLGCGTRPRIATELWAGLIDRLQADGLLAPQWLPALHLILNRGPLARRLATALDDDPGCLLGVYRELCECLHDNHQYPGPR
ncbi:MAG TPA: glutamate-cysteine ligase family protein [Aromatoleum sp.]|uniref:carboxylate-amine ligase n=1 Tax=Aromatoleum sp. TaxID=2307007 RepID=UPI002B495B89|nr:glutamate-cysteine ligase family protein [Aromatoleum sp.]HJV24678.1 glutamate-cysteine ligase family protein [Aromatoleum sp.]